MASVQSRYDDMIAKQQQIVDGYDGKVTVDQNDSRLTSIEAERQKALSGNKQEFNNLINQSNQSYNNLINQSNKSYNSMVNNAQQYYDNIHKNHHNRHHESRRHRNDFGNGINPPPKPPQQIHRARSRTAKQQYVKGLRGVVHYRQRHQTATNRQYNRAQIRHAGQFLIGCARLNKSLIKIVHQIRRAPIQMSCNRAHISRYQ